MFDRVLVPLDGSKLAEVALPYVEELSAKMGLNIILLTILESEETHEYEQHHRYIEKIVAVTKHHAKKYIENEGDKAIEIMTATRTGNPADEITEYATMKGFPLIIMASHGRSGINRWSVGSVADKVVRSGRLQPVMLIRARESRSDIREKRLLKKALVPLDGSTGSETVIPYITEIAPKLEMELTLLQVVSEKNRAYKDAEAYLQKIGSKLKDKSITVNYKVSVGATAENIIDLADELAFDLVAMSTRGTNRASLLSLGSVAQKVFLGGNTPLLLIKK